MRVYSLYFFRLTIDNFMVPASDHCDTYAGDNKGNYFFLS